MSRSGEEVSPKQASAEGHCSCLSSSRLAKGAHLSESPSRLSETFLPEREVGQECSLFYHFSALKCWLYVCIDLAFKVWIEWFCMSVMIHGLWWMSLTWFGHVACMDCFMEWKWWVWYGFDLVYEWGLVMKVGMSLICMISIYLIGGTWCWFG